VNLEEDSGCSAHHERQEVDLQHEDEQAAQIALDGDCARHCQQGLTGMQAVAPVQEWKNQNAHHEKDCNHQQP